MFLHVEFLRSTSYIAQEQLSSADTHLLEFCKGVEHLYTENIITPNMHLQCHLKDCYVPLHGFWCFSFERFNGILGDLPNNNRSIEVQVMKRFVRDNGFPLPEMFSEEFQGLFPHQKMVGSLLNCGNVRTCTVPVTPHSDSVITSSVDIIYPVASTKHSFSQCELLGLK